VSRRRRLRKGNPPAESLGASVRNSLMKQVALTIAGAVDASGAHIEVQRISEERARRSLFRILKSNMLCSMATVTAEGRAHINTAYFSFPRDLVLYFLSHPSSTHCRNLATNPSIAIAVFSSRQIWSGPDQGLHCLGFAIRQNVHTRNEQLNPMASAFDNFQSGSRN
jgi:nitroimidazol reductase NimA-like FMN-containing flavoprotein (pyridoxamine 5'-phosphate oxidase superfamily)